MADNINFNELIKFKVDITGLQKQLDQAYTIYKTFADKVNKLNIKSTGATSGGDIDGIKKSILALSEQSRLAGEQLTNTVNNFLEQIAKVAEQSVAKIGKVKRAAKDVNTTQTGGLTPDSVEKAAQQKFSQFGKQQLEEQLIAQRQEAFNLKLQKELLKDAAQREAAFAQARKDRVAATKAAEKAELALAKQLQANVNADKEQYTLWAKRSALVRQHTEQVKQSIQEEVVGRLESQKTSTANFEKELTKRLTAEQKAREKAKIEEDKRIRLNINADKQYYALLSKRAELNRKQEEQTKNDLQKEIVTKAELQRRSNAIFEAGLNKRLRAEQAARAQSAKEESGGISESTSRFGKFFAALTKNFAASAGTAIKYAAIFKTFSAVTAAATAAISAPFLALRQGLTYLQQLEKDSINISQALVRNAKFSNDNAENLRKAAEYARLLAKEIDEISARTGIEEETLSGIAKIFIEAGGLNFVKDRKQVSEFIELYGLAVQSTVNGSLAIASAITDITDLFTSSGEGLKNNKFLEALDLGNAPEKWIQIREEARRTGDIIAALGNRATRVLTATAVTQGTLFRTLNSLRIVVNSTLGEAAEPIFEKIVTVLLEFITLINNNKQSIISFFNTAFQIIASLVEITGRFVLEVGKVFFEFARWSIVKATLASIVAFLGLAVSLASTLATAIAGVFRIISAFSDNGIDGARKALKQLGDDITETMGAWFGLLDALGGNSNIKRKADPGNPLAGPGKKTTELKTGALASAKLEAEKSAIDKQLAELEERFDRARNLEAEKLSESLINKREYADRIKELNTEQIKEQARLFNQLSQAVKGLQGLALGGVLDPIEQQSIRTKFQSELEDIGTRQIKSRERLNDQIAQAERAGNKEFLNILKDSSITELELIAQNAKAKRELLAIDIERGFKSKESGLRADREIALIENDLKEKQLELEIERLAKGSEENAKATNELRKVRAERLDIIRVFDEKDANQREQTAREEQLFVRNKLLADLELTESLESLKAILANNKGFLNPIYEVLAAREKELIAIEEIKIAEAALAKSREANSERSRQLEAEALQASQNRLQATADRIAFIDSNVQDASLRQVLRRRAIRKDLVTSRLVSENPAVDTALRDAANKRFEETKALLKSASASFSGALTSLTEQITGINFAEIFGKDGLLRAGSTTEKFAGAVSFAGAALTGLVGVIDTFKRGFEQGGLLGGVGGVLTELAPSLARLPVVGEFIQGFGAIFSVLGGLLTRSAKKVAEGLQKELDATLKAFDNGSTTLVDTIKAVQAQRDRAIIELSGKKGGKKELEKLLPGFDDEIEKLLKQQTEIISNFEKELFFLSSGNDLLEDTARAWEDINKKVKEYVGAGGDAAKAQQFLELQISKLRNEAIQELADAEQEAIQNALRLNDLLKERQDLINEFKQQEFDILTRGAIERRQTGAVAAGTELQRLKEQLETRLKALDDEIRLETIKVDKTREVFNLTNDIAALRRRDEEFALAALDAQISRWRALRDLVNGISTGGAGFLNTLAPSNVFNVTINAVPGVDGAQLAGDFSRELETRFRLGLV